MNEDDRDLEILALAALGMSEREIAREMALPVRTVARVLAADAREFPGEPLVAAPVQPGGEC